MSGRQPGQTVFKIEMQRIAAELEADVERMRQRKTEDVGQIRQDRRVLHNKPVIAGTRIPASAIWEFAQAGYDVEGIIREYPRLTPADVQAAIEYEEERRGKRVS